MQHTTLKKYQLVTEPSGSVLAVRRMTADELKRAIRRDRHVGQWKPCNEERRPSLLERLLLV
jgi:hypothetical protein